MSILARNKGVPATSTYHWKALTFAALLNHLDVCLLVGQKESVATFFTQLGTIRVVSTMAGYASAKLRGTVSMQTGTLSFATGIDLCGKYGIKAKHFSESCAHHAQSHL